MGINTISRVAGAKSLKLELSNQSTPREGVRAQVIRGFLACVLFSCGFGWRCRGCGLIGEGLGHGFVAMEDDATVAYLITSPFSPKEEFEINPLDPEIGIEWGLPVGELRLSPKDAAAPSLAERLADGKLP